MEKALVLLVSFVLVLFCSGQNWTAPDFCHHQQCPQYKLIKKHHDFEERLYVATEWITTKVESTGNADVMAAHLRLKRYFKRQNDEGYKILDDTWPVLITVTKGNGLSLSWFVPPGTTKLENTDPSITLQSKPEGTIYVRVFNGAPNIQRGQEHANTLWKALHKNCTHLPTYTGAGYESYFSLVHHNEIWIYAYDINCKKAK